RQIDGFLRHGNHDVVAIQAAVHAGDPFAQRRRTLRFGIREAQLAQRRFGRTGHLQQLADRQRLAVGSRHEMPRPELPAREVPLERELANHIGPKVSSNRSRMARKERSSVGWWYASAG